MLAKPRPSSSLARSFALVPPLVWAAAGLAVALRATVAAGTGFTSEDSLITLRYAEKLAAGQGFVYNDGERVLGTTTPLYTLFLALALKLGFPAAAGKAASILADGALCLALFAWLRGYGWERAGVVAAFLAAVNPIHARWSVSGMESSLVALTGVLALLALSRGRLAATYAALAVLFLLRWDGALLVAVVTAAVLLRDRRVPWAAWGGFALVTAPWLLFAAVYFGNPIPVTAAAKSAAYARQHPGFLPQADRILERVSGNPLYVLAAVAAAVGLIRLARASPGSEAERPSASGGPLPASDCRPPDSRLSLWAALAWFALYWAGWLYSGVLLFEWYLVPPLPIYEALIGIGLSALPAPRTPAGLRAVAAAAVAAAVLGGWRTWDLCARNQRLEDALRRPLGLWLREQSRPTDTVMLEPIGYIGYYSRLRVLDAIGLVSPEVIPLWRAPGPSPFLAIARTFHPEWCVLRPAELDDVRHAALAGGSWDEEYALARTFRYEDPHLGPVVFHVFRRRLGR